MNACQAAAAEKGIIIKAGRVIFLGERRLVT
jgi:hypothetical protein